MAREIERKFLVKGDDWRVAVEKTLHLKDGLVAASPYAKVRVRVCNDAASITVKSQAKGPERQEYEYQIAVPDAVEMINTLCGNMVLEKHRHLISYEGFQWVVDEYIGLLAGIVIAEIELDSVDTRLPLPVWVGEEVTADPRYKKRNMLLDRLAAKSDQ